MASKVQQVNRKALSNYQLFVKHMFENCMDDIDGQRGGRSRIKFVQQQWKKKSAAEKAEWTDKAR